MGYSFKAGTYTYLVVNQYEFKIYIYHPAPSTMTLVVWLPLPMQKSSIHPSFFQTSCSLLLMLTGSSYQGERWPVFWNENHRNVLVQCSKYCCNYVLEKVKTGIFCMGHLVCFSFVCFGGFLVTGFNLMIV